HLVVERLGGGDHGHRQARFRGTALGLAALARARAAEDQFACHCSGSSLRFERRFFIAVHYAAPYGIIRADCPKRGSALSVPTGVSGPGLNGKQVRGSSPDEAAMPVLPPQR